MTCSPALAPAAAAAIGALAEGATHYTDVAGLPELRDAVAARCGVAREQVLIAAGVAEGVHLALRTWCTPGDTVLVTGDEDFSTLGLVARPWQAGPGEARVVLRRGNDAVAGVSLPVIAVTERLGPPRAAVTITPLLPPGWQVAAVVVAGARDDALAELKQGLTICTAAAAQHAALAALRDAGATDGAPAPAPVALPPRRARRLADAGTRERYALLDLLARTPGAISLGRGDPDLPTPQPIVDAAIAALLRGDADAATDPRGLPALRAAVARKLAADNGVVVDPGDGVLITTGGQEAIFLALQALLGPGDEVLMPDPRYTAYDVAVAAAGARIVGVPPPDTGPPVRFALDADAIAARISPRSRAILIIAPGNPTGAVAGAAELRAVARLAAAHDLVLIADEMYEQIVYDDVAHVSLAACPEAADRTLTVGGFSKAYAMTGWRVGYLAGPSRLVAPVAARKDQWSGCAPVLSQHAALAALDGPALVAPYAPRRRMTLDALARMGFAPSPSQGAFYVFFSTAATGLPAAELARRLLTEAGVFVYPGSGFGAGWASHVRLAWLQPEDRLAEALDRIERWLR